MLNALIAQDWVVYSEPGLEHTGAAQPATGERYRCPQCRQGRLQVVAIRMPQHCQTRWQARSPPNSRTAA